MKTTTKFALQSGAALPSQFLTFMLGEDQYAVGILHIKDDHVGDVVESRELDATRRAVHGQALVSYRRTLIAGRLGEEVVKVVGHGFVLIKR